MDKTTRMMIHGTITTRILFISKYSIAIHPEEEGGYTALIPDLLGCVSQGETLEEVIANIKEARELWIATVYFSGKKEIPLPSQR
jgi:antitoxin HicB